ncbi:MAG: hypothetical protein RJB62_266 [Pseudomonadota bacterium]
MASGVQRFLSVSGSIFATFLLAASPEPLDPVGLWYGEGQPHDPNILYLDQFGADGTFRSEFRRYERCEIVWQQVEEGRWNMEGDLIITIIDKVNGIPALGYQEYIVEELLENEIRLRHTETEFLFIERRIDRLEFPGCFIGS